jgi:hypothetical protein
VIAGEGVAGRLPIDEDLTKQPEWCWIVERADASAPEQLPGCARRGAAKRSLRPSVSRFSALSEGRFGDELTFEGRPGVVITAPLSVREHGF